MLLHHFTIGDRLHDERVTVLVHVYVARTDLHAAASAFNGNAHEADTQAVTQAYSNPAGTWTMPVVRIPIEDDNTVLLEVLVHEMHHAATAIYGTLPHALAEPLTHHNEPFAYLHSDLVMATARQLQRRSIGLSL